MNKWLGLVVGLMISGAGVAACSTTTADKYPTYDAMCTDVATQECQVAGNCGIDATKCATQRKQVCLAAAAAAITTGGRSYTAGRAEDCVNKTKEVYAKSPPLTPTDLAAVADTCGRVYAGTKAKGDTCTSSFDCTGSLICDKSHCGDKVDKKNGELCANPGEVCETGSYCATVGDVKQCTPKVPLQGACDPVKTPCIESARCDNAVCQPKVGIGQTCNPTRETDPNADCTADGPYCDAALGNVCTKGLFSLAGGVADCAAFGGTSSVVPDAGTTADTGAAADTGASTDAGGGG
jgi:hypothetical protein